MLHHVDVPIEDGEDLTAGIGPVTDFDTVRHVTIKDVCDVTADNGRPRVEQYSRLTLHFDPDGVDDAAKLPVIDLSTLAQSPP